MLSASSIAVYNQLLSLFSRDIKNDSIITITHNDIISRATTTTYNTYLRQLKALFNFATENNIIDVNPCTKIKTIPTYNTFKKTISDDNLQIIFNELSTDNNKNY